MSQHVLYSKLPHRTYLYTTNVTWLQIRNTMLGTQRLWDSGLISQYFGLDVMVDNELQDGMWEIRHMGTVLASGPLEIEHD